MVNPSMSDNRLIRAIRRGVDDHVVWLRNPRRTKWNNFKSLMNQRVADFRRKYGKPSRLEKTNAYIRTASTKAFEKIRTLGQKTTG